jgi:hypothetical protein
MDAERREWLEVVASICEGLLETKREKRFELPHPNTWDDTAALLRRIRAELAAG